ncbi:ABC transporter substrate-binding protein [Pararhodobacter oceanensis]|uniref:ABC transporter substrate-binding protein n=1 Tax=Pararhodobacter oceanensis TaxID=2172121 RepID=UPI003A930EF9
MARYLKNTGSVRALSAALAAAIAMGGTAAQAETTTIGLPSNHSFFAMHLYVAEEMGYFGDLDIEYMIFNGGSDVARQIANGSAEIGYAQPTEILLTSLATTGETLPIRYWYMLEPHTMNQIAVPVDSDIQTLADISGRIIGISRHTASNVAQFRTVLERNGLDPDVDVVWRAVGLGGEHLMALETGTIDVSATNNMRHAGYEFAGVPLRVIPVPDTVDQFGNGLFSHNDVLADEAAQERLVKVARGVALATEYCGENPQACVELLYGRYPELQSAERDDAENLAFGLGQVQARNATAALRPEQNEIYGFFPQSVWDASVDFLSSTVDFPEGFDASVLYTNDIAVNAAE